MLGLGAIIFSILPPFILLALGALIRKYGIMRAEADASLSMITVRVLYPAFILYQILNAEDFAIGKNCFITSSIGFLSILLGFGMAWIVSIIAKFDQVSVRSFKFCSGIFNYGFIAIPIGQSLFGAEIVVHIILFNLGVEIAIWTVGVLILTGKKFSYSGIFNPPAMSVLVALLLKEFGGSEVLPSFLWDVISMVGQCSIPLGLMLIGGSFYDLLKNFSFSVAYKTEICAILVRNLLFPCLVLLCIYCNVIPSKAEWISKVLVVQGAMPAGIFAIVIVRSYYSDSETAIRAIFSTMVVSIISLPVWLVLGINLLN